MSTYTPRYIKTYETLQNTVTNLIKYGTMSNKQNILLSFARDSFQLTGHADEDNPALSLKPIFGPRTA